MSLQAEGIVVTYDERVIVDHVDLLVEPGRITAMIGPNGAGKTTLFNALSGVLEPDEGRVLLGGVDVTALPPDARARRGMARTFQQSTVFASLTVEENLRVAAESRHRDGLLRGLLGRPDRRATEARRLVEDLLGELGLRPVRHVQGGRLPTGTLRTVELGRALCTRPSVLLLDEPASGLDDVETEELHGVLHRLASRGLALLLVEHDLDLVRDAADTVAVLASGRLIAVGAPAEVIGRADVRSVTLGIDTETAAP
ncbi:MAG: ABC transporter ATP-binding protein [Acidimicrobiales bacterium]